MDICMDKEPDGVVVYANGDSCNPNQDNVPEPLLDSVSRDEATGNAKIRYAEGDMEVKEYDVKECTSEIPVGKRTENDFESTDVTNSKLMWSAKHGLKSGKGSNKTRSTVPQPFSLETEKRASSTRSFSNESLESAGLKKCPDGHSKVQKQATKVPRKPLEPKNKKLSDEEDSCSVASYATSTAKSAKSKAVTAAPSFRSTERAEKRREFYIKLEKKHQAIEAEKTQNEARNKEESEAALRHLRKNLSFKANPMPNFYHEGPPPKVELKKRPPTRAKSPKLGRRNLKEGTRAKGASRRHETRKTLVSSKDDLDDEVAQRTDLTNQFVTEEVSRCLVPETSLVC